jgi:hypothetical protein
LLSRAAASFARNCLIFTPSMLLVTAVIKRSLHAIALQSRRFIQGSRAIARMNLTGE